MGPKLSSMPITHEEFAKLQAKCKEDQAPCEIWIISGQICLSPHTRNLWAKRFLLSERTNADYEKLPNPMFLSGQAQEALRATV